MRRAFLTFIFLFFSTQSFAAVAFVEADTQDCDGAVGTCTETGHAAGGAGTITLVAQFADDSTAADRDTGGCTMGGNAMTRLADNEIIGGNIEMDVYWDVEGTAGDIVCNWGGTISGGGMITVTYNGIDTTSQPDAIAEDSEADTGSTVIQQDILTVAENDMLVDFVGSTNSGTSFTGDTGQQERADLATGQLTMASSEELATTATTYTQGQTAAAAGSLVYKIVAIDPSAAAASRRVIVVE